MPPSALPSLAGLPLALFAPALFSLCAAPTQARNLGDNGRCDDLRYETSNHGHAEPGTDEYDCSRYGQGLKEAYRRR